MKNIDDNLIMSNEKKYTPFEVFLILLPTS